MLLPKALEGLCMGYGGKRSVYTLSHFATDRINGERIIVFMICLL